MFYNRRGITLIELLIVVGILALLAGLLFPVLTAIRSRGREAQCIGQLRQVGMAFRLYRDDYGQRPPDLGKLFPAYVTDTRLFLCPEDRWIKDGGWAWSAWGQQVNPPIEVSFPISYGYFFSPQLQNPDVDWQKVEDAPYPAGYLVCVLHGEPINQSPFVKGAAPFYNGNVLRVLFNGEVVRRKLTGNFNRDRFLKS